MGSIVRGKILRGDMALFNGRDTTATRVDALGGTITGLPIGDHVDILAVYGSGTDRSYSTLSAAVTNVGSAAVTFWLATGTWTIATNLTLPSNVNLYLPAGAKLSVSNGITLTVAGRIFAEVPTDVYTGAGTVTVSNTGSHFGIWWKTAAEASASVAPSDLSFPPGDVRRYGASGNGTDDDSTAIQNAILVASTAGGGEVFFPRGTYKITSTLTIGSGMVFRGEGRTKSIIDNYGGSSVHAITTAAGIRGAVIQNLKINGQSGSGNGIHFAANFGHVQIIDVQIVPAANGINAQAGDGIDIYMRDVRVDGGTRCFQFDASGNTSINTLTAVNCYASGTGGLSTPDIGWDFANISAGTLIGCSSDNHSAYGFSIGGNITLIDCTAEVNTLRGFSVLGVGQIALICCKTASQTLPFSIYVAADTTLINCQTTSTTGNSLEYSANATGENLLVGGSFDASTSVNAAANLVTIGAGSVESTGKVQAGSEFWIADGITAPSSTSGYAKIFVDTSDGDLKVIFGDGTTKTIVVDT